MRASPALPRLLREVLRVDTAQVHAAPALRAAIGVSIPLAIGAATGQMSGAVAVCVGALNIAFSDHPGPYRSRARSLLLATLAGGMSVFVGSATGGNAVLAVLAAAVWGFGGGLLAALGPSAMQIGVTGIALLVVFSGQPGDLSDALLRAGLVVVGGLFETGLALVAWPISPYAPQRSAMATVFERIAHLSQALSHPEPQPELAPPLTGEMSETSRGLAELSADDSTAEALRNLFHQAELIRLELLSLAETGQRAERNSSSLSTVMLLTTEILGGVASQLARRGGRSGGLGNRTAADLHRLGPALQQFAEEVRGIEAKIGADPRGPVIHWHLETLGGELRAAVEIATTGTTADAEPGLGGDAPHREVDRLREAVATLRANLTRHSAVFRHACRLGITVAVGDAIGHAMQLPFPYWVPLTVAVVLRPDFSGTFSRGLGRTLGTLVGLAGGAVLAVASSGSEALRVLFVSALIFAQRTLGAASFVLGAVCISALVVLLLGLAGEPVEATIVARATNTLIGGVLAMVAYALWPTWERDATADHLADLLDTYADYTAAVMRAAVESEQADPSTIARTRRAARLARTNALVSLARLQAEPGTSTRDVDRAQGLLATSHRLVRSVMALETALQEPIDTTASPASTALALFARDLNTSLRSLANAVRDPSRASADLADLRVDERALQDALAGTATIRARDVLLAGEADRITNSVNTILARVRQGPSGAEREAQPSGGPVRPEAR